MAQTIYFFVGVFLTFKRAIKTGCTGIEICPSCYVVVQVFGFLPQRLDLVHDRKEALVHGTPFTPE